MQIRKFFVALMTLAVASVAVAQEHTEFKYFGLYGIVDYSYAVNMSKHSDKVNFSQITGVIGFQTSKEVGLGLGVTVMRDPSAAYTQLPVFVELRSHFSRKRLTPYTSFQLGATLPLGDSNGGDESITFTKGGIFFGANVGMRFAISRYLGVSVHAGYQLAHLSEVEFVHEGILARREPVLFHLVRGGVSVNF